MLYKLIVYNIVRTVSHLLFIYLDLVLMFCNVEDIRDAMLPYEYNFDSCTVANMHCSTTNVYVTNDDRYVSFVVMTIRSFPH